jgi:aminoglycoside 2'-N-acetyltransferase I
VTLDESPSTTLANDRRWQIRQLLDAAFDDGFSDDDWAHALGGVHVWVADDAGQVISHGALVERTLVCSGHVLDVGYVEAVATLPSEQRRGHGAHVMRRLGQLIQERCALGVLSTGEQAFYERFGWEKWRGPTFVDGPRGRERTADDDGGVMILRTARTPSLDLDGAIVCDWRRGDVW